MTSAHIIAGASPRFGRLGLGPLLSNNVPLTGPVRDSVRNANLFLLGATGPIIHQGVHGWMHKVLHHAVRVGVPVWRRCVINFELVKRLAKAVVKLRVDERVGLGKGGTCIQSRNDAGLLKVFGLAAELFNTLYLISEVCKKTFVRNVPYRTWTRP